MKHFFYLLILGLAFNLTNSVNLYAQEYPQPNAEWTYCTGNPELDIVYILGVSKLFYTRDTLIAGTTYNVVEPELNTANNYNKYYTRYSNDTVYRWVNDAEYLYFHFNLSMGEVFTTFRSIAGTSDTACTSILPLLVIDSTTVTIGGEDVTSWRLRDTLGFDPSGTGSPYYPEFWLYEKFGFATHSRFYHTVELLDCNDGIEAGFSYLAGYNDDTFDEWVAECPVTSIEPEDLLPFRIYPNPINPGEQILNMELPNYSDLTISICDIMGNRLFTYKPETDKVQLNLSQLQLAQGIYQVMIFNTDGVYHTKRLVTILD